MWQAILLFLMAGIGLILLVTLVVYRARVKAFFERVGAFYREVKLEMKKVSWPSRQEVVGNTIIVLVTVAVLSVLIGVEDQILGRIVQQLFTIAGK